ncbi:MAG: DUF427 domain-containing protein [Actinomycetota bacterium]
MRASWKGQVIAESDDIVRVEGNAYFPQESLNDRFFADTDHHSICPWKGRASYLDVVVDGERNEKAAWYYPKPFPLARRIKGRVAFWNGVKIEEVDVKRAG